MQEDIKSPIEGGPKNQKHPVFMPTDRPPPEIPPKKHKWWPPQLNRKQWLKAAATAFIIVVLGGIGIWTLFLRGGAEPEPESRLMVNVCQLKTSEVITVAEEEVDSTIHSTELTDCSEGVFFSPLTGLEVTEAQQKLPVSAVMVENSPAARPQSGLREAGLVFEAIAEGGITRFLALYQEDKPKNIGPIRSLRPYYIDLFVPFDAPIAHVGGSGEALHQVRVQNIKTFNQMSNSSYYTRVTHRYAPHNVYTSRDKLLQLHKNKGWDKSDFTGFNRLEEADPAKNPKATQINLNISSHNYNVSYKYDKKNNNYKRYMAGRPHIDADSSKQITPKVIIALTMARSQKGIYSVYKTSGSNQMVAFYDGKVVKGTWSKKGRTHQLQFKNSDGEDIHFAPGQTWITLVANSSQVTYN